MSIDDRSLGLPEQHIVDKQLLEQVQKHNGQVHALQARKLEHLDRVRGLVSDCFACQDSASTATAKQLALDDNELECLRDERVLWEQQADLLTALRADADKALEKAEQELDKTKASAAKKLAVAGITPETMKAWPADPRAAQVQFDHQLDVVPAVRDAKVQCNLLRQYVRELPAFQRNCHEAVSVLDSDIMFKLSSVLGKPVPQQAGK